MIRNTNIPHSIRILLTERCNLHCAFCLNDSSANRSPSDELKTSEWLTFFERLKELMIFNITVSGGEIFLRDEWFVLLNKLRENRMHRITLLSNGTLITGDTARRLNQLKIKNISISLDGLMEQHDKLRGKGSFQKTIEGIQHLIAAGISPNVSFTAVRSNCDDLAGLIDRLVSIGVSSVQVNTLTPEGRCFEIYKEMMPEFPGQEKQILDVVEEKKKEYPELKLKCDLGFYYYLPETYEYFKKNPRDFKPKHLKDGCGAACTSCTVTSSGEVVPCEGLTMFPGGNIRELDLLEIWRNSENFKKIREIAKIPMAEVPHCKDCRYIHLCDGGCRASAQLIYNDLLAPCILCPFFDGEKADDTKKW